MFQRYLTIGIIPEIRSDPLHADRAGNELELIIPLEKYLEIQDLLKDLRYSRLYGHSTQKLWAKFSRLIYPCIVNEKDKLWYRRNAPN